MTASSSRPRGGKTPGARKVFLRSAQLCALQAGSRVHVVRIELERARVFDDGQVVVLPVFGLAPFSKGGSGGASADERRDDAKPATRRPGTADTLAASRVGDHIDIRAAS